MLLRSGPLPRLRLRPVLSWTPLGRHIVFVGANREVARLAGVNVTRIRAGSYIVASAIAGLAGLLLVATVGGVTRPAAMSTCCPRWPASSSARPWCSLATSTRWCTWFSISFLATGILGLQLLGYTGWVQDAFYGAGLVLAVTVATLVRARTSRA